jgi:hypothetical protein
MTTERVLPAIALPRLDGRAIPVDVVSPITRPKARSVTGPQEKVFTAPSRAGILIGASAAIYAVTLAAVAGLQASDDAALAARRQPYLDAIVRSRAANDALDAAVSGAEQDMVALAGAYAGVTEQLTAYEARLDALATLVAEAQGSMAALPSRIGLPTVSMRGAISPAGATSRSSGGRSSAPKPATKTRASGG